MKDLKFKSKQAINNYLRDSNAQKFDESVQGNQGIVYRLDDMVIKIFLPTYFLGEYRTLQFRDVEIPNFYFTKAGIFVKGDIKGCLSEFAEGNPLRSFDLVDEDLNILKKATEKLFDSVLEVTDAQIRLNDVNLGNILFDKDHFNIIDTLSYYLCLAYTQDHLMSLNARSVFAPIFFKIFGEDLYNYFEKNGYLSFDAFCNPIELFERLVAIVEDLICGNFETSKEAIDIIEKNKIILPTK